MIPQYEVLLSENLKVMLSGSNAIILRLLANSVVSKKEFWNEIVMNFLRCLPFDAGTDRKLPLDCPTT